MFNTGLTDHCLYLGYDFNAESVRTIEAEIAGMRELESALQERFQSAMQAAEVYVRASALRGQIQVSRPEASGESGR